VGLFEAASGGTLFLDELGELSLSLQAKLLRVLENKKVTRVGDTKERAIDVRIVAATNRKLDEEVKAGRFRQDLYFRLASAVVLMPPLRERRREIALLARLFVAQAAARLGQAVPLLAPAALDVLQAHGWPGNLRELKNAMEYAVAVAVDDTIEPENLPTSVVSVTPQAVSPNTLQQPLAQLARAVLRVATGDKLEAIQEVLVQEALTLAEGNKSAAARLLGVHRKVIERRVTKE
jgi:transcriptional regulator with PAS, ATPase and Fis domain